MCCNHNKLSELFLTHNITKCYCCSNNLTNFICNDMLETLYIESNSLTTIKLNSNLKNLDISNNLLENIELNNCLKTLDISYNCLNTLNVPDNIIYIICDNNKNISNLIIPDNLQYLYCLNNPLPEYMLEYDYYYTIINENDDDSIKDKDGRGDIEKLKNTQTSIIRRQNIKEFLKN